MHLHSLCAVTVGYDAVVIPVRTLQVSNRISAPHILLLLTSIGFKRARTSEMSLNIESRCFEVMTVLVGIRKGKATKV